MISHKLASIKPVIVDECVECEGALLGDMYMKGALLSFIKREALDCDIDIDTLEKTKFDARFQQFWLDVCETPADSGHRATPCDFVVDGPNDEDFLTIPLFR